MNRLGYCQSCHPLTLGGEPLTHCPSPGTAIAVHVTGDIMLVCDDHKRAVQEFGKWRVFEFSQCGELGKEMAQRTANKVG